MYAANECLKTIKHGAAVIALGALIRSSTLGVLAAPSEVVIFQTSDVDVDHNYGVAEGSLRLSIGSGGEILGYFRAVDQGRLIDVHGALTGTKIYFYIGDRIVNGTYKDGKLDAFTLEGARVHHFTGLAAQSERS